MTHPLHDTALDLYLAVLPRIASAGRAVRALNKKLASQLDSAAQSVATNLAEADTPCPGNSRSRVETAFGSLRETRTHLRVAVIYGYLEEAEVAAVDAVLDRVAAMTWKRSNARRRRW